MPVALGAVRVSERAAAGVRADEYASAVFRRDAASGKLLAQAAGPELLLSFDRPWLDAACTVVNVRAPAVVAHKVLYPPGASGRFDLLINGRVQAAAAGDARSPVPSRSRGRSGRGVRARGRRDASRPTTFRPSVPIACGRGPVVAHARAPRDLYRPGR